VKQHCANYIGTISFPISRYIDDKNFLILCSLDHAEQ